MVGALDAFEVRLQHAEESAARAEAGIKPFEDRIKSLEIDRVQLNELSHNIEGLNLNLRSPRRQIIDCIPSRQLCDAQCKDEEVLVGGGCYVPTEGASGTPDSNGYGIVANSYPDNENKTWHCGYVDIGHLYDKSLPLSRVRSVAYCVKRP
jgi:hypothetical protein